MTITKTQRPMIKSVTILILLLVSFATYFNALFGDFVYDDASQILANPWIRDIRNIPAIFSHSVWGYKPGVNISNYYRPLMHIVYMFNYYLFGLKPWGFHLINVIFHCGASVLVFLIIRRLLNVHIDPAPPAHLSPSFLAAMLFAAHPVHTEAVAWVSGLPDVASTFFYLLSFYLYVRSKAPLSRSHLFSSACFGIAALFKEPALTLPVILLAYDYLFRKEQTRLTNYVNRYLPYLIIIAGYLALRIHALGEFSPQKSNSTLSAFQYAINAFPLFAQYLSKLLIPLNLNAFYVFHPIASLFELKGFLSLIATVAFSFLFLISLLKKSRIAFLGLLFMTVPLLPVLYVPVLGENPFAERYLYLPSVGFVFLPAVFLSWAKGKMPHAIRSITILLIFIWGLYTAGSTTRNIVWKDSFNLWSDTVKKSPDSETAHNNLAIVYGSYGQWDKAIAEYGIAILLNPDSAEAHTNLGMAYTAKGQWDKAIAEYQKAIQIRPDSALPRSNLGVVYAYQGQLNMAIAEYKTALRLNPDSSDTHNNLGVAYSSEGQLDSAIAEYKTALRLNPQYAQAHYNLGIAFTAQGQLDSAIAEYQTALELKPDFHEARQLFNEIMSKQH